MAVKNIAKAYLSKEPTEEAWYVERLNICKECPSNTNNMNPLDVTFIQKSISTTLGGGKGVCSICSCPIKKKASVKIEECGKVQIGEAPLWNKIEDVLNVDQFMKLRTLSPSDLTLDFVNKQPRIKKVFDPQTEPKISIKLLLTDKRGLDILKVVGGCTCTATSVNKLSQFQTEVNLDISTTGFALDVNERTVTIFRRNGLNLTLTLQFTKQNQ